MRITFGHNDEPLTEDALEQLLAECERELGGAEPKAGMLFASVEYDHDVLVRGIRARWPEMPLIGASSDGEISSRLGFCHDSVLLVLFHGEDVVAEAGLGRNLSQGIEAAVDAAFEALTGHPVLCLTSLAPTTNSSEVVRAVSARLGDDTCPLIGGLSGDHREFSRMAEFFNDEVVTDSLPLLFLSGDIKLGWGIGSGWFPIGDTLQVTRSDGHVVYEIEGRPALEIYHDRYGATPSQTLGEYPLAIYADGPDGPFTMRAVLDSDHETGSLRFAGEVPEGATVRMTEVLPEGILSGSTRSLTAALESFPGERPEAALVFSCAARKWVLGTQAELEIEDLQSCAAALDVGNLAIAGLYCFGEIAPNGSARQNSFHNETCVTLVLGE